MNERVLEPAERIAEALFGLIMVLTFTGSLSVAEAGRDDVRTMLIGALGCNIAWGIIDGILYLMACLSEQGRGIRALRALHQAPGAEEGHRAIASVLPPLMAVSRWAPRNTSRCAGSWRNCPRLRLECATQQAGVARRARGVSLGVHHDTSGGAAVPLHGQRPGMRCASPTPSRSALLFVAGYAFGRVAEYHPWLSGLAMVLLGGILVVITIALGG